MSFRRRKENKSRFFCQRDSWKPQGSEDKTPEGVTLDKEESRMKEIKCMDLQSRRHHPVAQERRRADYYQSMYDMMLNCTIVVTIVAAMATGVLLAVSTAAGLIPV